MKQTVNIRKENNQIKVHFMYNDELYDIMKKHNGWFYKKEKCWVFPSNKLDDIKKDIKEKHHVVNMLLDLTKVENPFNDPLVITVYGHCKKCGNYSSIHKNGFCLACLLKK